MILDPMTLHPHDDLAVYALDALGPDEQAALEAHLAICPACQAELDHHRETLAALASDIEAPPPAVWDAIAAQLGPGQSAQLGQPRDVGQPGRPWSTTSTGSPTSTTTPPPFPTAPPASSSGSLPVPPAGADILPFDQDRPRHTRRSGRTAGRPRGMAPWLAVAAAAVVVVVGIAAVSLRGSDDPDLAETAAAAAEAEGSTVIQLATATGDAEARVVRTEDGQGYVLLDNLPELPQGRTYQLWKMNGTDVPISLGTVGDGTNEAATVGIPPDTTELALSDEPDPGSPTPTGPIVATGAAAA